MKKVNFCVKTKVISLVGLIQSVWKSFKKMKNTLKFSANIRRICKWESSELLKYSCFLSTGSGRTVRISEKENKLPQSVVSLTQDNCSVSASIMK